MLQNKRLTPKQHKLIASLLAGRNMQQAASAAKCSEATAYRWLDLPHVAQAYDEARQSLFDKAMQALIDASEQSVATLMRNLSAEQANVQVRAAQILLEQAITARKLTSPTIGVAGMAIDTELLPYLLPDDLAEIRRRFDLAEQRRELATRKAQ